MNIGKALGLIGITIVAGIAAALGVRITLNAIDGKPLLEAPNTSIEIGLALPEPAKQPENNKSGNKPTGKK